MNVDSSTASVCVPPTQTENTPAPRYGIPVIVAHVLVLVLSSLVVFHQNRSVLLGGYDGNFYRTTIKLQREWTSRAAHFGGGPLQGMGNVFFMVNTRWVIGFAVPAALAQGEAQLVLAYTIIAIELFLGTVFLGWCFRLQQTLALLTAWLLTVSCLPFSIPPLCYPISCLAPQGFEQLAACLVIIGLFHRIGQHGDGRSVLGILAIIAITFWLMVSSLSMIVFVPLLSIFAILEVKCAPRKERTRKVAALILLGVCILPTAVPVHMGSYLYSVPTFFGREMESDASNGSSRLQTISWLWRFNASHGYCGPFVLLGAALGAALAWYHERGILRRMAVVGPIVLGLQFAFAALCVYGLRLHVLRLAVFEMSFWPLLWLSFVYLLVTVAKITVASYTQHRAVERAPLLGIQGCAGIWAMPLILALLSFRTRDDSWGKWFFTPPPPCPLVLDLRDRVGLNPGAPFRGSVATFTGYRNKPDGACWTDFHFDDSVLYRELGCELRAMGLWYHGIPTLHEYNQMMTPPFYFMTSRILARPQDVQRRAVIVLTRPDIPYLRSLGVRYIVTDQPLEHPNISLVRRQPLGDDRHIHVYELADPNLGNYSPTKLYIAPSAAETLSLVQQSGFDYRQDAVLERALFDDLRSVPELVPATWVRLRVHKDRYEIEADSEGTSLLLLPFQYSHCLDLDICDSSSPKPRLVRLNLMQAGLLFHGRVRTNVTFAHGPFRNPFGRLNDYRDAKALRLGETCRIPSNKQ